MVFSYLNMPTPINVIAISIMILQYNRLKNEYNFNKFRLILYTEQKKKSTTGKTTESGIFLPEFICIDVF